MRKITAKKEHHKVIDMPDEIRVIQVNFAFSKKLHKQIKMGFIPVEMGDRWFIYYSITDDQLHFHELHGVEIYRLKFHHRNRSYFVDEICVNLIRHEQSDEYILSSVRELVRYSLLSGQEFD